MSEPREDPRMVGESTTVPPPPDPTAPRAYRSALIPFAALLLLLVIAVAASAPFWAPALPWAPTTSLPLPDPRIDQLETAVHQDQQQRHEETAATKTAMQRLDQRLAALEARPAPMAALEQVDRRLAALETKATVTPSDLAELRQQLAKLTATASDLAARVEAIDKAAHDPAAAEARTNTAIALVLLQINTAISTGRPFPAEYEALAGLARNRHDIQQAAALLAEPAKNGVAGRAVLAERLRQLRGAIVSAPTTPAAGEQAGAGEADWTELALRRIGRLVTIRRIDGGASPSQSGDGPTTAAVDAAQQALAGGDLDATVATLDKLTGPAAEAAGPWLRMAKDRLAVETALRRIETMLAAHLGAEGAAR